MKIINTKEKDWFKELVDSYKNKINIYLKNDGNYDIDPTIQSLVEIGRKAEIDKALWKSILINLGLSASLITLILATIFDPEPITKLILLTISSIFLCSSGLMSVINLLTKEKPNKIEKIGNDFKIYWD